MNLIQLLRSEIQNKKVHSHDFNAGDVITIKTSSLVNKKRKQVFKGICISYKRNAQGGTILLRNVIAGEAVEQTFPLSSAFITEVHKVPAKTKIKKSKLYYIRNKPMSHSRVA
jgi:large subunit ribosomal protein L19